MAVTSKVYGQCLVSAYNKEIDWDSDTIKVMLCTSSYTPNQNTHRYKSSVTNEVSGTGYTAGGQTVTTSTPTMTSLTFTLPGNNVSWTTSTITARYAVCYDSTGTDSTSPLIAYWDFGADVASSAGTFTLTINASGIVSATVA